MDFALRAAQDGDFAHSFGVFKLLLDPLVRDERQVADGARRGDGDLKDGRGVGVELLDHRRLRGLRKVGDDQVDLVLNFLRGDVAILRQQEADDDDGAAFRRCGADVIDQADGIHRVFDFLGDLRLDLFGRGAGIGYGHGDGRDVDLRKQIDAERKIGKRAHHDERENQHRGEDRAADAELSESVHYCTTTGEPSNNSL